MSDHTVNTDDIDWSSHSHGDRYECRRKKLSAAAGGDKLGASLYEVPPGKTAWPRHYHMANEEAIFILQGRGTLRIGDQKRPVRAGAYIALPAGENAAHQLSNTADEPLRYLCLSTMQQPDVLRYPDSDKIGVFAGGAPGGDKSARTYQRFLNDTDSVAYWEGE